MGIFNIFNKRSDNGSKLSVSLPVIEPAEAKEEIKSIETPVMAPTNEERSMTISYATGWPIDVIYGYLHKSYESKGFDDAMLKSDLAFRDLNMNLIKNKILMVFREINLNYDVMKQDLQTRIANCNAAGLLTTVSELEKTMSTIPLQSYDCGFLRGIASIQMSGTNGTIKAPVMQSNDTVSLKRGIA